MPQRTISETSGWRGSVVPSTRRRFALRIPVVDLFDLHHGDGVVARVAQGDLLAPGRQGVLVDRQGDRDGKERAVAQAHLGQDALVIRSCP